MKMSFLMSVAIGIATIVAFIVLWVVPGDRRDERPRVDDE